MRVTYNLFPKDDWFPVNLGDHVEISENADGDVGVLIRDFIAPKHVLHQYAIKAKEGASTVSIEYHEGRELFEVNMLCGLTAFDPPSRFGLSITADLNSDPRAVEDLVSEMGFSFDTRKYSGVQTDDYYSWMVPLDMVAKDAKLPDAVALRISVNDATVTQDEWYYPKKWNEFLTDADEVGVFDYTYDIGSMLLEGRVYNRAKHSVLGKFDEEDVAEAMMFQWFPKHLDSYPSHCTPSIAEPYGLHPKLQLDLFLEEEPPLPSCRLYSLVDLPNDLFLDAYELQDLAKQEPAAELIALWGDNDLEKPQWQANESVSALFQLHNYTSAMGRVKYTIPMHTRYQLPKESEKTRGTITSPHVFFACVNDDIPLRTEEYIKPHEYMGIESVFPIENTQFIVLASTNDVPYEIPAITPKARSMVEQSTMIVILLGALCVLVSVLLKVSAKAPKKKVD